MWCIWKLNAAVSILSWITYLELDWYDEIKKWMQIFEEKKVQKYFQWLLAVYTSIYINEYALMISFISIWNPVCKKYNMILWTNRMTESCKWRN